MPFLARLLTHAFPGLVSRDLGLPAGRLLPWLPGVRAGLSGPLDLGEAALLGCFRQTGRPLLGLDPLADACPDPAWNAAPERLAWREAPGDGGDATLTLIHGGLGATPVPAGQAQLMLLLGNTTALERHALLLPQVRLAEVLDRLGVAAAALAGPGWQLGGRLVSPRLASLVAQSPNGTAASVVLDAGSMPNDLAPPGLLAGVPRLRLLLGALPPRHWQLRLGFTGAASGPVAFFVDGRRQPTRLDRDGRLAAEFTTADGQAVILGLAWPDGAPAGLQLGRLDISG
ncbi:MAG: hypothetical protein EON47_03390 [Acetobacteraceae bacterium]|nr:MAG: hypothetical protein EON47_03390 [Acetobacteraceae bacterium]